MERREHFYAREVLNLPRHGSSAHMIAQVAEVIQGEEWWEEITLLIGDRNRVTSFDLATEDRRRRIPSTNWMSSCPSSKVSVRPWNSLLPSGTRESHRS
jgi:hypothetical protein